MGILDGFEQPGHVLAKAPQPVGAAGFQRQQVPAVGVDGLLEAALLVPLDAEKKTLAWSINDSSS